MLRPRFALDYAGQALNTHDMDPVVEQTVTLNGVDIIAIIVILVGTLNGLRRGLSGEIAATISAVLALFVGLVFYQPLGRSVANTTTLDPRSAQALTFMLSVAGALAAMMLMRLIIKHAVTVVINNKRVDRVGGTIAGCLKSTAFTVMVILCMNMWEHEWLNRVFGEESMIGSRLKDYTPDLREQAEAVKDKIAEKMGDAGETALEKID